MIDLHNLLILWQYLIYLNITVFFTTIFIMILSVAITGEWDDFEGLDEALDEFAELKKNLVSNGVLKKPTLIIIPLYILMPFYLAYQSADILIKYFRYGLIQVIKLTLSENMQELKEAVDLEKILKQLEEANKTNETN